MKTGISNSRVSAGLLAVLAFMLAFAVSAGTKKWTGAGDGINWSDPLNWDANGVPVTENNDIVYLYGGIGNTANSINNDIADLVIRELRFEGSADIALNGEALTFANDGANQPRIVSLVNGSEDINIGISVVFGTSLLVIWQNYDAKPKDYRHMSFNGVISGEGGIQYRQNGNATIEIRGANTYSGGTDILKAGGVYYNADLGACDTCGVFAYSKSAFGSASSIRVAAEGGVTLRFSVPDAEFGYDIDLQKNDFEFSILGSNTYTGNVAATDYSGKTMRFITSDVNHRPTLTGDITLPDGTLKTLTKDLWNGVTYTAGYVDLQGKIICAAVGGGANYYSGRCGSARFSSAGSAYDTLTVAASSFDLMLEDVVPSAAVIYFDNRKATLNNRGAYFDLNGHDQSVDRAYSNLTDPDNMSQNIEIRSTAAATLTMNATDDATLAVPVNGQVSLVWNPSTAKTLTYTKAASATAGPLTVAAGTMVLGGTASFANVPSVTVGANATFDVSSTVANALASATAIAVGVGGTIRFGSAAASPLPLTGVTVNLDTTSTLYVGAGIALQVAKLYVDGQPVDGGTYTEGGAVPQIKGAGSVTVESSEVPTKPANWVADGADTKVTSLANWDSGVTADDLVSGGLYPTFAKAGTEAFVDGPVGFKGIVFDIPGGQEENAFDLVGVGPISLYGLGITAVAPKTDEKYVYSIDVPVMVKKALSIDLSDDADVTLALKKPISGAFDVETSGKGTLQFEAANTDFTGNLALGCGKVVVKAATNAFGSAEQGGRVIYDGTKTSSIALYGTIIDRPVDWSDATALQNYALHAVVGTNVFSGTVTVNDKSVRVWTERDAVLRFDGDFMQQGTAAIQMLKQGAGTLEIAGKFCCDTLSLNTGWGVLSSTQCKSPANTWRNTIVYLWGGNLRFGVKDAFNTSYSTINFYLDNGIVDLDGFDQHGGKIIAFYDNKYIAGTLTSDKPATYVMTLPDSDCVAPKVKIAGQVSFVVCGSQTRILNYTNDCISTTYGSFAVTNANAVFTANASWLNPTNGAVSVGGIHGGITINSTGTFSKAMDFRLGGTARLTLAEGVTQRCARLYLDGSTIPAAPGTWGATGSGAQHVDDVHFAGKGVLKAGGGGVVIIFR